MPERFSLKTVKIALLPLLVAGAIVPGVGNHPTVAEAGGCRGSEVITSENISPETFSQLQEDCKLNDLLNQKRLARENRSVFMWKINSVVRRIAEPFRYLIP